MALITVDMGALMPPHLLHLDRVVAAVMPDVAEATRSEIVRLAGQKLHQTFEDYIQGLQPVQYGDDGSASIVLVGQLPNMIENGWGGGDMKPALLTGRSSRTTKDGKRYAVVPFRHGTPGSRGTSFQEMGQAHVKHGVMAAAKGAKLGRRIHSAAKRLSPSTTHSEHGAVQHGERLRAGMSPKLKDHHVTDIHHGMVKQQKTYGKAVQNKYMTFRAVSDRSRPAAFVHPGIEAAHLFEEAAAYANKAAAFLIQQALDGAAGTY